MRFPVSSKLVISLSALAVFGLAVIGVSYHALNEVRSEVATLASQRHPMMAAAHEIEVNVSGLGLAVLAYLERSRPSYREWANQDVQDIRRLLNTYAQLAKSEREHALAASMRAQLDEFTAIASSLLDKSDAMTATQAELTACVEEVDTMIHAWIARADALPAGQRARSVAGVRAALAIEAETAELGMALAGHTGRSVQSRSTTYPDRVADLTRLVEQFERLAFNTEERRAATEIVREQRKIGELIERAMALDGEVDALRDRFIERRNRLDRFLDDEVQPLAHAALDVPLREVNRLSESAVQAMAYAVFPLFIAFTLALGFLMYRGVTKPLLALKKGLRKLGEGERVQPIVGMPNDEFGDLATEFNRMTQQLLERSDEIASKDAELRRRETMASMGALVSGVAHEVRNPLFGITSTLDALQARAHGQPEQGRHIEVLRGETGRLQKLMQDLLDYGKPAPHVRRATDLYAVIGRAVAVCRSQADERQVRIVCELHGESPRLALDAQRIEQVFVNLIENALQHSEPGTEIDIGAWRDVGTLPAAVVCAVSDQGPGFRSEDLPRVFEPFFTRRRGGTGLGLSIVQRIVEEHGGNIIAANGPPGGAVLTLRLPFVEAALEVAAANDNIAAPVGTGSSRSDTSLAAA